MTIERAAGPWHGSIYNGFTGGEPPPAPRVAAPPPRRNRALVYGGVAAALVAGVALGLLTRPELGLGHKPAAPMRAVTGTVPVEIVEAPPAPPPAPSDKLEVLSPDLQAAASAARVLLAPPPVAATPREVADVRASDPSFDCRVARSRAEEVVCGDDGLARLDRRMSRAFQRALDAGVPFRALRGEQNDWLAIREDAARESPGAVADVYRQRIRELNQIADNPEG